jgi:cysteine desulfurase
MSTLMHCIARRLIAAPVVSVVRASHTNTRLTNRVLLHQVARCYSSAVAAAAPASASTSTTPEITLERSQDGKSVYLDFQATTPVDPRVLDAMLPHEIGKFGNAHSRTHIYGWEGEEAVDEARENVADLIGANAKEVIFTSGATESNNIAIKGVARFYKSATKNHIITTATV